MFRDVSKVLALIAFSAAALFSQTATVPAAYSSLYTYLGQQLTPFEQQVKTGWNGSAYPVEFSAELLSANGNRGLQLLVPSTLTSINVELTRLRGLGVRAVTINIAFPELYQPFYTFNGDPADYQKMLDFYRQLIGTVHAAGLKLVVESSVLFPGYYSQGSGFALSSYYASLTPDQLTQARVQTVVNLATLIHPDYINLGSEPSTQAELTGDPTINTPAGYAAQTTAIVQAVHAAGVTDIPLAAGVGSWEGNASAILTALLATPIDIIDLHVYPINLGFLTNVTTFTDRAIAAGKKVAISEAWLQKETDAELTTADAATGPGIESRDAYSFFAPLDQRFLTALVQFSQWKHLVYFSPFYSRYFWAYLDYTQVQSLTPEQVAAAEQQAAGAALVAGQTTSTGLLYQSLITSPGFASVLSGASFLPINAAPSSAISIFGTNLAAASVTAAAQPLPTSLGAVTVTITDAVGTQAQAGLFYVSPGQVNALVPEGLQAGPATLSLSNGSANPVLAALTIEAVAPAMFTAPLPGNAAVVQGIVVTATAGGGQTITPTAQCSAAACMAAPVPAASASGDSVLELYATGVRHAGAGTVKVLFNGQSVPVYYTGAQGQFAGLDQINAEIPANLAGAGLVTVQVTIGGAVSNTAQLAIQ